MLVCSYHSASIYVSGSSLINFKLIGNLKKLKDYKKRVKIAKEVIEDGQAMQWLKGKRRKDKTMTEKIPRSTQIIKH